MIITVLEETNFLMGEAVMLGTVVVLLASVAVAVVNNGHRDLMIVGNVCEWRMIELEVVQQFLVWS